MLGPKEGNAGDVEAIPLLTDPSGGMGVTFCTVKKPVSHFSRGGGGTVPQATWAEMPKINFSQPNFKKKLAPSVPGGPRRRKGLERAKPAVTPEKKIPPLGVGFSNRMVRTQLRGGGNVAGGVLVPLRQHLREGCVIGPGVGGGGRGGPKRNSIRSSETRLPAESKQRGR